MRLGRLRAAARLAQHKTFRGDAGRVDRTVAGPVQHTAAVDLAGEAGLVARGLEVGLPGQRRVALLVAALQTVGPFDRRREPRRI
jgi:hypothetical protein